MSSNSACKICGQATKLYQADLSDDRYGYPGTFSVYRCSSCGFGQLYPTVSAHQLEELYTQYYPRKTITAASVQANAAQPNWLYQRFAHPGQRILDVGCGDAASLLQIQAQGAEAYGTEFDHNVEIPARQLNLSVHFGNIDTLPQPDHWFDVIILNQLLEHIDDPVTFLRTIKRKLKPAGQLVVTTPHFGGIQQRVSGRYWINWHIPFHVNFFSRASVQQLAQSCGLRVESMNTFTPQTWVTLQVLNLRQPNRYWQPRPTGISILAYLRQLGSVQASHLLLAHALGWLTIPFYRLIDLLRGGDSWFIVFRV